jgi:hypothetical protein
MMKYYSLYAFISVNYFIAKNCKLGGKTLSHRRPFRVESLLLQHLLL